MSSDEWLTVDDIGHFEFADGAVLKLDADEFDANEMSRFLSERGIRKLELSCCAGDDFDFVQYYMLTHLTLDTSGSHRADGNYVTFTIPSTMAALRYLCIKGNGRHEYQQLVDCLVFGIEEIVLEFVHLRQCLSAKSIKKASFFHCSIVATERDAFDIKKTSVTSWTGYNYIKLPKGMVVKKFVIGEPWSQELVVHACQHLCIHSLVWNCTMLPNKFCLSDLVGVACVTLSWSNLPLFFEEEEEEEQQDSLDPLRESESCGHGPLTPSKTLALLQLKHVNGQTLRLFLKTKGLSRIAHVSIEAGDGDGGSCRFHDAVVRFPEDRWRIDCSQLPQYSNVNMKGALLLGANNKMIGTATTTK